MDQFLRTADSALRTLFAKPKASEPSPARGRSEPDLGEAERRLSGALMRVNHVGEVCAQALYLSQAAVTRDPLLREELLAAAREEIDHLAWTQERLDALGSRPSLLNPLWFAGAFVIGWGRQGQRPHQPGVCGGNRTPGVGAPAGSPGPATRGGHAITGSGCPHATGRGAPRRPGACRRRTGTPAPARLLMKAAARVMTTTAHYI